jgi:transaldolase
VDVARTIAGYAPNVSIKLPACRAGLEALRQCVADGIAVTATISFSVAQVAAIEAAYQKGMKEALSKGIVPKHCNAVIMVGRLEDYLMMTARDNAKPQLCADIPQAGVMVAKKATEMCLRGNYSIALMCAGMRTGYQIQSLAGIGGRISVSPALAMGLEEQTPQKTEMFSQPMDEAVLSRLMELPDFCRAYEPDGMSADEFIGFAPFQRTAVQFYESGWERLGAFI